MTNGVPYSLDQLQQALGYVESSNRYDVLGPPTRGGGRAYGRYQVMDFNIPSWTQQYLGQQLTPEQFLADPAAQDAVFAGRMGEYYGNSTGDPANRVRNAASLWFTGQPYSERTAGRSDGYINNQQYGDRVLRALGAPQGANAMVMNPDPQQPQGLFGGIRNMFGGGQRQPDPNAGSNTDPFANLSRSQRTMLGFAALRDAAASLEGRDSSYFNEALGGFEAAQERERLRAQGLFANQVQGLEALFNVQQQIARDRSFGIEPSTAALQLEQILSGAILENGGALPSGGGAIGGGGGGVAPVAGGVGGVSQEQFLQDQSLQPGQSVDAAGRPMGPYTGEPEPVVSPAGPTAPGSTGPLQPNTVEYYDARQAELMGQLRERLARELPTDDIEFLLQQNTQARDALADQAQTEARAQSAAETRTPQTVNTLETVQDLRDLIEQNPGRTTGFVGSLLQNVPGSQANDARALSMRIRANLGFDQLQALREASPTGGALGGVAVPELEALQATIGNLDLSQSPEQILNQINDIEQNYMRVIRRAYETSQDVDALDRALGGRPDFMIDGGAGAGNGDIPQITTDADYEALPSGAQFMAPDGTIRRKP